MTGLVTVKAKLVTLLAARPNLSGVPVSYGRPVWADDLVDTAGSDRAIWLEDATGQKDIPYMVSGAKPTEERVSFTVVCQAIAREESTQGAGQQTADTTAAALLAEVESVCALDPSLGLTSPHPVAVEVQGWIHRILPPAVNAWGARFDVTVAYMARLAAPS